MSVPASPARSAALVAALLSRRDSTTPIPAPRHTRTAAAIALRAAERGRRVVVLTIDPARRLAQSLGVDELDNTPRPVRGLDVANGGSLDAMMLDMKRTFDEVVLAHSTPETAGSILENPFYVALSSQFAGTQEYMAMEKLGQLHAEAVETANRIWSSINEPNLVENILPTRGRATLVMTKGPDHAVSRIRLRKL